GLWLKAGLLHLPYEPDPVLRWDRDESAGYFDDVESDLFAFPDVLTDRIAALPEDVLEESTCRYQNVIPVAEIDQLANRLPRHQRKRSAGELERIDVNAHRLQNIFQVSFAHRSVVRPAYFGKANLTRLGRPMIGPKKRKRTCLIKFRHTAMPLLE